MANIDKLYEDLVQSEARIFYLYGPYGSGKTQLIHQIAERYMSEHPSANIFYVNSVSPIDKNRLDQADIVVLDEFDLINGKCDELTLGYFLGFLSPKGRRRVLLFTGQTLETGDYFIRNTGSEFPFHTSVARMLVERAVLVNVQELQEELFRARTELYPELAIYVDPGSASAEAVGELLSEISHLYRMIGGSGITFTNSGVAFPEGVQ